MSGITKDTRIALRRWCAKYQPGEREFAELIRIVTAAVNRSALQRAQLAKAVVDMCEAASKTLEETGVVFDRRGSASLPSVGEPAEFDDNEGDEIPGVRVEVFSEE